MRSDAFGPKKETWLTSRTRRQFLQDGSKTVAGLMLVIPGSSVAAPTGRTVVLEEITLEAFAALRNTTFRVLTEAGMIPLVLVQISLTGTPPNSPAAAPDANNEKFALLFVGSVAQPLMQDTYWFEQPKVGRFPMFIAPIGHVDSSRSYYEAIFNRPPVAARPGRGTFGRQLN